MTIRLSTWIVLSVVSALIWSGIALNIFLLGWWGAVAWACIFALAFAFLFDPANCVTEET
jgi:hypothetical protein